MNFLLTKQEDECGSNPVTNCCKYDYVKGKCTECESGFFPLNDGCIPCDDENEGQKGCEGSCDSSKYSITRNVLCDKCKEGYYNIEGICLQCSIGSPNCTNCSYEVYEGSDKKIFKCLKCVNDDYRVDGKCRTCSLPPNCLKCRYAPETHNSECIQCQNGFHLMNGKCYSCYKKRESIVGGSCYYYFCPGTSDHKKDFFCSCSGNYALTPQNTCIPCFYECIECYYDQSTNSGICYNCCSKYGLTPQNTCIPCPINCQDCKYDDKNEPKCTSCGYGFGLLNDECISCGEHYVSCKFYNNTEICNMCEGGYTLTDRKTCELELRIPEHCGIYKNERFNNKSEYICTSCRMYYTLDSENNRCISCPNACTRCHLDDDSNNFYCDECANDHLLNASKLCEHCTRIEKISGVGCAHCYRENNRDKCTQCRIYGGYVFIKNDEVCKLHSDINLNETCYKANRLDNGQYSCFECRRSGINTLITRFNGISDCYSEENELVNCRLGYEDEYQNLTCTKCKNDIYFIWSEEYKKKICNSICPSGYFFNNDLDIKRGCYKCDDERGGGQIGCDPNFECSYITADNHLYCNGCKPGYFLYDWQCLKCSKNDIYCIECDYNIIEKKSKCNKCINDTFIINEEGFCQKITYDEYPKFKVGCILPINNYTKYIENNKCFSCKNGFFKTREESCIYCKARKNGGPKCYECQYIKDENGIETNIINCKTCKDDNILSPIGKRCYKCEDEVGPGCAKCAFEEGTERVICEKCEEDYEPNDKGYCTNKNSYINNVPNCLIYEDSISNSKRLITNVQSCKICNDGFYLDEGRCKEIFLETCSFKSMININKSIYDECIKFCEMNYYSNC